MVESNGGNRSPKKNREARLTLIHSEAECLSFVKKRNRLPDIFTGDITILIRSGWQPNRFGTFTNRGNLWGLVLETHRRNHRCLLIMRLDIFVSWRCTNNIDIAVAIFYSFFFFSPWLKKLCVSFFSFCEFSFERILENVY